MELNLGFSSDRRHDRKNHAHSQCQQHFEQVAQPHLHAEDYAAQLHLAEAHRDLQNLDLFYVLREC